MNIQTTQPVPSEFRTLWTRQQTQEFLNVGRSLFYELLSAGIVPQPIKLGTANRWIPEEVENAVISLKNTPAAADIGEGI